MPVVFCGVCPHPPVAVPEVGRDQSETVKKSQEAMLEMGRRLKESGAEVLLMITPHGPIFGDGIGVNMSEQLKGSLARFGAPQVSLEFKNEVVLADELKWTAGDHRVMVIDIDDSVAAEYNIDRELDHGLMVPLYFLNKAGVHLPLVAVSMGMLPLEQLYAFGLAVREAADKHGMKVAVLASGDMSHCLIEGAPSPYNPRGGEFDREMVRLMGAADARGIFNLEDDLVENAAECGLRPIIMMLGALDGFNVNSEVLSYEGPFGVGYMVVALEPGEPNPDRALLDKLIEDRKEKLARRREGESYLVRVAREAIGKTFTTQWEDYDELYDKAVAPPEFVNKKAGVFVSLKKHGHLRGCIGTVEPTRDNIVEETVVNALNAAFKDPRFYPLKPEEYDELDCSVDILYESEPVKNMDELNPQKYGVIVRSGARSGLLLPDLEGVNTPEEQVAICRQKAGIEPEEPVELERFEVVRYK